MTLQEQHHARQTCEKFGVPEKTWYTTGRVVCHQRPQSLEGEGNYLVTEVRGNERFYDVPWKVSIKRDAYDFQSWARVYRWDSGHLGGGTTGDWTLVTTEPIERLPIIRRSYVNDTGVWEHDMRTSLDKTLEAGLAALGLI